MDAKKHIKFCICKNLGNSHQNKDTYSKLDENSCNRSEEEHDVREYGSGDIEKTNIAVQS